MNNRAHKTRIKLATFWAMRRTTESLLKIFAYREALNKKLIKERKFQWTKDCKSSLTTINAKF